jgi:hypothetical protein
MSHTPGPWELRRDVQKCLAVVSGGDSQFPNHGICRVWRTREGSHMRDIGEANARLIAAAPELMKALLEICNAVGEHPDSMHTDGSLHAAFIKAAEVIRKASPPPPPLRGEVTEHSWPV